MNKSIYILTILVILSLLFSLTGCSSTHTPISKQDNYPNAAAVRYSSNNSYANAEELGNAISAEITKTLNK
jgi:uncharacterized protein YceK